MQRLTSDGMARRGVVVMARYIALFVFAVVLCGGGVVLLLSDPPARLYVLRERLQRPQPGSSLIAAAPPRLTPSSGSAFPTATVRPTVGPRTLEPVLGDPRAPGDRGSFGPPGAKLEVSRDAECVPMPGGVQFVGGVRNVGDETLAAVVFVVTYIDREGSVILSASVPLDPAEFSPGEVADLQHAEQTNRLVARCSFEFRDATGAPLANRVER